MNKAFNKDILQWSKFPQYDIVWTDPPWGQKMVNYFETLMLKNGQQKPKRTIENIIEKLGELADQNKPIFIEYSIRGHELVVDIMANCGHNFCNNVYSVQENGKPYLILVFNSESYSPDGSHRGFKIIDTICKDLSFNVVFDPFAGIGKTAKQFIKNGKIYLGSEINEVRFNKLKKVLWEERQ